jgi:hypothetical protein
LGGGKLRPIQSKDPPFRFSSYEQDRGGGDGVAEPEAGEVEDRQPPERRLQARRRRRQDRKPQAGVNAIKRFFFVAGKDVE